MNTTQKLPEVWMRGPVEDIPALLQPVAHALLQAREEVEELMKDFPEELLWQRPSGVASVGFHLQHLSGVINRLFTYARKEMLTQAQLDALNREGVEDIIINVPNLLSAFSKEINNAIEQVKRTPEQSLAESRGIGRKQIPTTVIGLLFHAAEHTMRHVGQLSVTVRVVKAVK